MINYEEELDDRQIEAVKHFEGPLLVLAGAGSGKTRVITYRIAYLIDRYGVDPENILAMTFTNKAANEMRTRVDLILGKKCNVFVSTFHSACAFLLRKYSYKLGYTNNYVIYDETDSKKIIKEILEIYSQDSSVDNVHKYYNEISSRKDNGEDILAVENSSLNVEVFRAYQKRLIMSNAMDFSDLIFNMVKILKMFDEIRERLSSKFRFILVDEFQDTNRIQMDFLLLLLKNHRNICVVGDDDQSIYRWRGATIENILGFGGHFEDAKIVKLEQNYRSTGAIISVAAELIKNNDKRHVKTLFTKNPLGENITFYTAENDIDEASFIASEILRLKESKKKEFGDFAVLVRTNAQMRIIEEKFRFSNIPYEVVGGTEFYKRKEIKDIISYLRVIVNPKSDMDFERILNTPPRGFGDATLMKIRDIAIKNNISLFEAALRYEKTQNFSMFLISIAKQMDNISARDVAEKIINETNYRSYLEQYYKNDYLDRLANIDELLNSMIPRDGSEPLSVRQFLENVSLLSDIDRASLSIRNVSIMTIHSAKGLEFPIVFIAGFEENLIPHFKSVMDEDEIAEERRLLYVAITRAREKLYLSYAKERFQAGLPLVRRKSRFFDELPHNLFTFLPVKEVRKDLIFEENKEKDVGYKIEYYPELMKMTPNKNDLPFKIGMNVFHNKFGIGVIKQIEGSGEDIKLVIFFEKWGLKRLLPSYVRII
ncbi:MAG: UvrD-helicase domain-containing protein [Deltaproteobacteria bacterium]|nr:UvrD-helicase domain-containing protein [Deltaproteobacteria bacterium]